MDEKMSKSLARVQAALIAAGIEPRILEMAGSTRTAAEAAEQAGCALDQIVKSLIFQGPQGLALFLTAGGRQVDPARASALAGQTLDRADPNTVRDVTGFAIGGVSPLGHLTALPVWADRRLNDFSVIWAAAGTPRHIFQVEPSALIRAAGAEWAEFSS
jgi:prolyl-tRNA editing enzyme YbaK/EbsC (Cys-tRNA(Pro) deacylase)